MYNERDECERKSQITAINWSDVKDFASTHKGCNWQSARPRPQYGQIRIIDHDSASYKLSKEIIYVLSY